MKGCPPEFEPKLARLAAQMDAAGDWYILVDRQVVRSDWRGWIEWQLETERAFLNVARDELDGLLLVSTIFLGMDHRHQRIFPGPPHVFETMVRGDDDDDHFQVRTSTWDEAMAAHAEGLAHARRLLARSRAGVVLSGDENG